MQQKLSREEFLAQCEADAVQRKIDMERHQAITLHNKEIKEHNDKLWALFDYRLGISSRMGDELLAYIDTWIAQMRAGEYANDHRYVNELFAKWQLEVERIGQVQQDWFNTVIVPQIREDYLP